MSKLRTFYLWALLRRGEVVSALDVACMSDAEFSEFVVDTIMAAAKEAAPESAVPDAAP